jgi:hypothetical protein
MPSHFIFLCERFAARLVPENVIVRGYADVRGAAAFIFGAEAGRAVMPCASVPGAGILLCAELLASAAFYMPLHLGRVRVHSGGFPAFFHAEMPAARRWFLVVAEMVTFG